MNWLAKFGLQLLLLMQVIGTVALAFLIWKGEILFDQWEAFVSAGFFVALVCLYFPMNRGSRSAMLICIIVCCMYLALFAVSVSDEGWPKKAVPLLGPLGALATVIGLAWTLLFPRSLR